MECDLLEVQWTDHAKIFGEAIGNLRGKALYTDATLACEGRFFPVHKLVLSTCSQYLSAIFEWTPCVNPVVVINNITCKELEALLDFMYIGDVQVKETLLPGVLRAAECLSIRGLVRPDEDKGKKSHLSHRDEPLWKRKRSHSTKNTSSSKSTESHVSLPTVPPQPKVQSNSTYTSYATASVKQSITKSTGSCSAESSADQTLPNHSQNHTGTSFVQPIHTDEAVKLQSHHPAHTHHPVYSPQPPHTPTEQISQHQVQNTPHIEISTTATSLPNHDLSQDQRNEPPILHPEGSIIDEVKMEMKMEDDKKDLNLPSCHQSTGTEIPELLNSWEHMRPLYDARATKDTEEIATLHAVQEPSDSLYDFNEGMPPIASSSNSDVHFHRPVQTASISFAKVEKQSTSEKPQDFTCQLCQRSYPKRESLTRHIQRIHKKDPYSCSNCSFQTRVYKELLLHKKMQHKVQKIHKCPTCDFTTPRHDCIRRHINTHSDVKRFSCDQCDFSSKRKQEVNRHVKNKHCLKQ
ncbi:hypothetical protein Pmani_027419 [Petrolisthes manimaculis]|uniref:Uncharacterized protein n=1 Tax=Petrolisthes manimaculis TaxID=1843537 RepID=A0AAE1P321_9EUCA|nr:hypothetical protein Pmani_027419 [Petrolisthes manimaculis]